MEGDIKENLLNKYTKQYGDPMLDLNNLLLMEYIGKHIHMMKP